MINTNKLTQEQIKEFKIALQNSILDLYNDEDLAQELLKVINSKIFDNWSIYTKMTFTEFGVKIENDITSIISTNNQSLDWLNIDPEVLKKHILDNLLAFYVTCQFILSVDPSEGMKAHQRMHN